MRRLRGLLLHVKRGTLGKRLQPECDRLLLAGRKRAWRDLSASGDPIPFRLPEGPTIELIPGSSVGQSVFIGRFERAEREFVRRFLRPGETFVDVGANVGLFSLIAAQAVGPSGNVIAVEPVLEAHGRLESAIVLNGFTNIRVFPLALSDRTANAVLSVVQGYQEAWTTFGIPPGGVRIEQRMVPTQTLDSLLRAAGPARPPALIKIDVEGWETPVIIGGAELLSGPNAPVLLVEFADEQAAACGFSTEDLARRLRGLGYALFHLSHKGTRLRPELRPLRFVGTNLVATKNLDDVTSRLE